MSRRRFKWASKGSLLSHRSRGFALPLALILGVAMTGVALTMLLRSRTTNLNTQSQRRSAESLSATEGGIDRTLAMLNRPGFSGLLLGIHDPNQLLSPDVDEDVDSTIWTEDAAGVAFGSGCSAIKGPIGEGGGALDIDIDDILQGSARPGSYEVLAYRFYQNKPDWGGKGLLMVEGKSGAAVSRVMQAIQVIENTTDPDLTFPGLLGFENVDMGNNDVLGVDGNVICLNKTNCNVKCSDNEAQRTTNLRDAVNALNKSIIEGDIFVGELEIPPVPTPPTTLSRPGTIQITGAATFPSSTDIPVWIGEGSPDPPNICQTDPTPATCAYAYNVSSINVSGNRTVEIAFKGDIKDPGSILPVIFHVSGDVDMAGSTQLITTLNGVKTSTLGDAFPPAHFRMYGHPKGGAAQSVRFSGNTCADAFLYFPTAKAGINGGGGGVDTSGSCGIRGPVWVKEWGLSNSNAEAVIRVRGGTANAIKAALGSDLFIGFGFALAANRVDGVGGWARLDAEVSSNE